MSKFSEKLAAARAARPYTDVHVFLDGELTSEIEALREQLQSASTDARLGVKSDAEQIQDQLDALLTEAGEKVTLRFTRLPGRDWSVLTSKCPARVDVPIDMHYGYNYDEVCEAAARYRDPSGFAYAAIREDDESHDISDEDWADLYSVLSGSEVAKIRDAIWELNEYATTERLQALVKGSGVATHSDSK